MRFLVDLDGVIVDFVAGALAVHGATLPLREVRWNFYEQIGLDAKTFYAPMGRKFWATLPWTREGQELWHRLTRRHGHDAIAICTSPAPNDGCIDGKLDWLRVNMPSHARRFVVTPEKCFAASPTTLLIDDNDNNVEAFRAAGGLAVLVPRPWNVRRDECDADGGFDVASIVAEV